MPRKQEKFDNKNKTSDLSEKKSNGTDKLDKKKGSNKSDRTSTLPDSDSSFFESPRSIDVSLTLEGVIEEPGEFNFFVMFNGVTYHDHKWVDGKKILIGLLPLDLKSQDAQMIVANTPLIFFIRGTGGKGKVDPDPLIHYDNKGGGNIDLWPLLLGEEEIEQRVPLISVDPATAGEFMGLKVCVHVITKGAIPEMTDIPLLITMVSAHCLPNAKDNTYYVAAIGLDGFDEKPKVINFGMSLSNALASKTLWTTASSGGIIGATSYSVPNDDMFIPEDLDVHVSAECRSAYWHALQRIQLNPLLLRERLSAPFYFEMAGVPRSGKIDLRGRYMGMIDATALLEPGENGLTTTAKMNYYSEQLLLENVGPLLDIPPTSAKASARNIGPAFDEFEHSTFITIRFDLLEPIIPKVKLLTLYDSIGFPLPEEQKPDQNILHIDPPPEDTTVDVRNIRVEHGALAVHKELSGLACRGAVPMNQSIKRTAANRLLTRVRTMLKQFSPGDCSYVEWQDTVTGQHAAARRAVSHSFAPQPPPLRMYSIPAAARWPPVPISGETSLADKFIKHNLKVNDKHPSVLISKALRLLEARNDREAKEYVLRGLASQPTSRFLLWMYGALEFNQGDEVIEIAKAALRITVKGNYSRGTGNAIGWAALHAINHYDNSLYAAFVAAKRMRKSYELVKEWKVFLRKWMDTSGEEEILWSPAAVSSNNPMMIASAFFLCLRCFAFSERLLQCYEEGCGTRGSRLSLVTKITPDVYYLRAASWLLRGMADEALKITDQGTKRFGPSPVLSQMQTTCLYVLNGWDVVTEKALIAADRAGADSLSSLLLSSALFNIRTDPATALQRAARAHKLSPSAFTALAIGRIYLKLGNPNLAERWAAVSVKHEPYLADGWAFLAVLALRDKQVEKARAMLRTARQIGPVNDYIEEQLRRLMEIVKMETLSDAMTKDLCFCDYLGS